MSEQYDIFTEYARMRNNGLESKAALKALRNYIDPLSKQAKEELAQHLRAWEAGEKQPNPVSPFVSEESKPKRPDGIKPLGKRSVIRSLADGNVGEAVPWVTCANCGKKNRKTEVFCYSCGHLLEPPVGDTDTRHFAEADESAYSAEYFGPDSVLLLELRSTGQYFEIRPQQHQHELVIGRSSSSSAMLPDIDLAQFQGAEVGVSRLHLALKYEGDDNAIQVHDLGSANGSFINGQKLHPKEVRVLRQGDELRLGRLVLRVHFRHPGPEMS